MFQLLIHVTKDMNITQNNNWKPMPLQENYDLQEIWNGNSVAKVDL